MTDQALDVTAIRARLAKDPPVHCSEFCAYASTDIAALLDALDVERRHVMIAHDRAEAAERRVERYEKALRYKAEGGASHSCFTHRHIPCVGCFATAALTKQEEGE